MWDYERCRFGYIASNTSGQTIRGEIEAFNKEDLARQLQHQGLFLVRWRDISQRPFFGELSSGQKRFGLVLALILGVALLVFFGGSNAPEQSWPSKAAIKKIQSVEPGMKRKDVELLFAAYPDSAFKPRVTRYFEKPDVFIEIAYEYAESSHIDDTVKGIVRVYRHR